MAVGNMLAHLAAFWPCNEASGDILDAHVENYPLDEAIGGDAGIASGVVYPTARSFNGSQLYRTSAGVPGIKIADTDFTLAAWAYLDSTAGIQPFFIKENPVTADTTEIGLQYHGSLDRFRVFFTNTDPLFTSLAADTFGAASTGQWYFVMAQRSGSTVSIRINNGAADSSATMGTPYYGAQRLFIGGRSQLGRYWTGRIGPIMLWISNTGEGGALNAEQRTWLYNSGAGRTYDEVLATESPAVAGSGIALGVRGLGVGSGVKEEEHPWYDPDGEGLSVWGAWRAVDKASLADSYLDESGNARSLDVGLAPSWDAVNGWKFNGVDQYLLSNFVADQDQDQAIVVQYSNVPGSANGTIMGGFAELPRQMRIDINEAGNVTYYSHGGNLQISPAEAAGNVAISGNQGYLNGAAHGGTLAVPTGSIYRSLTIGARNATGITAFLQCDIQAVVIYRPQISPAQLVTVVAEMGKFAPVVQAAYLTSNPIQAYILTIPRALARFYALFTDHYLLWDIPLPKDPELPDVDPYYVPTQVEYQVLYDWLDDHNMLPAEINAAIGTQAGGRTWLQIAIELINYLIDNPQ